MLQIRLIYDIFVNNYNERQKPRHLLSEVPWFSQRLFTSYRDWEQLREQRAP